MTKSVNKSLQNTLSKSFERQAVSLVKDSDYSADNFSNENFMFVPHSEALSRLNNTMDRLIRGNAQIFYTMLFKDQSRSKLIVQLWNTVVSSDEFKKLPDVLKELELEQAKKLGPTSRFTEQKLFEGFIKHVDKTEAAINRNREEFLEAADAVVEYWTIVGKEAIRNNPDLLKYLDIHWIDDNLPRALPKDKSGGYQFFSNTSVQIAGVEANDLYYRDYRKWYRQQHKWMAYEEFCRVQNKGNTLFDDLQGFAPISFDAAKVDESKIWLDEKNRVVQGDSRSMQFPYKPIDDILTKIVSPNDVNCMGWQNLERRNVLFDNMFKEFYGKYQFDSWDATEYDASTDPWNQELSIRVLFRLARALGLDTSHYINEDIAVRHFVEDPTITTRGIWRRKSTPSGGNPTGPGGTANNYIRCWVQTARLLGISSKELVPIMIDYNRRGIPLFSCVGDDAWQLRALHRTDADLAEENLLDGYMTQESKILRSKNYIHFLQLGNYYEPNGQSYYSYYPVMRTAEKCFFQETANENESSMEASRNTIQSFTNLRYNPLQYTFINFMMDGDPKWRFGAKDPASFIKATSNGKSVAEALNRQWDPTYSDMSWEQFAEANRGTFEIIARAAENYPKPTGVL